MADNTLWPIIDTVLYIIALYRQLQSSPIFENVHITEPTGRNETNPDPNPNTKFVLIHYVINAGPFISLDPATQDIATASLGFHLLCLAS